MSEMNPNRKEAFDMLDQRVNALAGMSIHDLPDTIEVANLVDYAEQLLDNGQPSDAQANIHAEVDLDWIQNLVFS